jgi:hypothetical protein
MKFFADTLEMFQRRFEKQTNQEISKQNRNDGGEHGCSENCSESLPIGAYQCDSLTLLVSLV